MADRPTNTIVGQINNGFLARMMMFSPPAIAAWLALANRADKNGQCHPSIGTLQEDTGLARATVCKVLHELRDNGEITIVSAGGKGGPSNQYTITGSSGNELVQTVNQFKRRTKVVQITDQGSSGNALKPDTRTKRINQTGKKAPAFTDELLEKEKTLIEKWNTLEGVRRNQGDHLTDSRRKSFRARLKAAEWWDNALSAMAKFPLKCFEGSDGWRPDMDWFLKPDSVTKILEGKYDWEKNNFSNNGQTKAPEPIKHWI